ncbi:LysR family transcriptional regulator [Streptomyces sp. Isolate_45]|uniref:LysR family transcriptional regulator n=1 Tax=Streptomyces sp. Isolate_45 TaxID=2950111 RepID=UPI002481DFD1|nr:LysR family transcriptional regulator [Streptomyces sp. Isolate_45]MDA5280137.1 LysR family transcriptional regulator [Streptomyces sp. Isolate_45]
MEIHQLRYLAAVVDEGTFTAAAARLHVSQSGISTQVGKLERELGQRLLERSGRRVRLTAAGEAVLPLAREALATLDSIEHTAAEFAQAVRGRVRLGMITGCSIPGFLDAVAELGSAHPGIVLSLHEGDSRALRSRVLARSLDLALVAFAGRAEPELDVDVIVDEPIAVVVPEGHPLARIPVRLADVQEEKVLCLPHGTGIREAYERSCLRVGIEPRVDIEASSPQTLLGLARRGAGVAVLSPSSGTAEGMRPVAITDAETRACLGLAIRPDLRSPAALLTLAGLRAALTT